MGFTGRLFSSHEVASKFSLLSFIPATSCLTPLIHGPMTTPLGRQAPTYLLPSRGLMVILISSHNYSHILHFCKNSQYSASQGYDFLDLILSKQTCISFYLKVAPLALPPQSHLPIPASGEQRFLGILA